MGDRSEASARTPGHQMKKLWEKIIKSGVRPDTPIRKARYLHASNAISAILGLWLWTLIPIFIPRLPHTFNLILMQVFGPLFLFMTPLLNRSGYYKTAQVWIAVICFTIVSFNAVHDSWNHLFLLATILIAFQYIDDFKIILAVTISRQMNAADLVGMLNEIFIGFDRAAIRLGVEKIKTFAPVFLNWRCASGFIQGRSWRG